MYPHERSLVKQLDGKPFALIGVNSDRNLEEIREIIKKKNLNWRSFQNDEGVDGKISEMWGIQGWPTIFIIDAKGVIRWTGHQPNFDKVIEECLAEIGHKVKIKHEKEEEEKEDKEESDKKSDKKSDKEEEGKEKKK